MAFYNNKAKDRPAPIMERVYLTGFMHANGTYPHPTSAHRNNDNTHHTS